MEELIQRVLENQSTVNVWKNNFKSEKWNDANDLHVKMFGHHLTQTVGCKCLVDFYKALNSTTIEKIMEKQNRRFVLKDKLIMMHREAKQFSKHSSEEDLIYLLSKHPDKIVDFETYPENWKEIVNAGQITKDVDPNQFKAEGLEETKDSEESEEAINEGESNPRKAELEAMTSKELKALIVSMDLEVPKGNKGVLVQFILDSESK